MTLRAALGDPALSQAELAALLDVTRRTLCNWDREGAPVTVRALVAAARELEPAAPYRALTRLVESVKHPAQRAEGKGARCD